jgi:hypothetical protein
MLPASGDLYQVELKRLRVYRIANIHNRSLLLWYEMGLCGIKAKHERNPLPAHALFSDFRKILRIFFLDFFGVNLVAVQMHLHQSAGCFCVMVSNGGDNILMILNDL